MCVCAVEDERLSITIEEELEGFFESPEDGPPKWLCMRRLYLDESKDAGTGTAISGRFRTGIPVLVRSGTQ